MPQEATVSAMSGQEDISLGLQWGSCVHPNCILFLLDKTRKTRKTQMYLITVSFPGGSAVKSPPANAGQTRHTGWNTASERSPGGGNGNPLQISCLEDPMDREAWWATIHGSQSRTQLSTAQHSRWVPHLRIQQTMDWWRGEPAARTWGSADTPWGPGTNYHRCQGVSLQSYYVISPKLLTTPTSWKQFSPISL